MCLAVPGKIVEVREGIAVVDFGGLRKEADLSLLTEAKVGDFVLVHAGYAIERISAADAQERLSIFEQIGEALRGEDDGRGG